MAEQIKDLFLQLNAQNKANALAYIAALIEEQNKEKQIPNE